MAIDSREEACYTLANVRQFLPQSARSGKAVHPSVIFRWIKYGLKAGDGSTVKLDGIKCGAALCTSREAIERFFAELTARAGLNHSPVVVSARRKQATSRQLVAAGLKSGTVN